MLIHILGTLLWQICYDNRCNLLMRLTAKEYLSLMPFKYLLKFSPSQPTLAAEISHAQRQAQS